MGEFEVAHLGQQHAGVFLAFQHGTQRCRNIRRRKSDCSQLIQQRLEEVKVPSVNEWYRQMLTKTAMVHGPDVGYETKAEWQVDRKLQP